MSYEARVLTLYATVFGLAAVVLGAAEILVWAGGGEGIEIGVMTIGGTDFFRWAWGGLIVIFGGLMMLSGARGVGTLRGSAEALLGVGMIWTIAGTDIFGMICENIPAGEDAPEFFNSAAGFIGAFAPPYPPALIMLPFTLVFVYLQYTRMSRAT